MAEAGPVPHLPQDGRFVSFRVRGASEHHKHREPKPPTTTTDLASGASLLVDVEFGRGHSLYAL
jgi:hypothetical protein